MKVKLFGITWDFAPLAWFAGVLVAIVYYCALIMLGFYGLLGTDSGFTGVACLLTAVFLAFIPIWVMGCVLDSRKEKAE